MEVIPCDLLCDNSTSSYLKLAKKQIHLILVTRFGDPDGTLVLLRFCTLVTLMKQLGPGVDSLPEVDSLVRLFLLGGI